MPVQLADLRFKLTSYKELAPLRSVGDCTTTDRKTFPAALGVGGYLA